MNFSLLLLILNHKKPKFQSNFYCRKIIALFIKDKSNAERQEFEKKLLSVAVGNPTKVFWAIKKLFLLGSARLLCYYKNIGCRSLDEVKYFIWYYKWLTAVRFTSRRDDNFRRMHLIAFEYPRNGHYSTACSVAPLGSIYVVGFVLLVAAPLCFFVAAKDFCALCILWNTTDDT